MDRRGGGGHTIIDVLAIKDLVTVLVYQLYHLGLHLASRQTWCADPMSFQRWDSAVYDGPTLKQHWVNV